MELLKIIKVALAGTAFMLLVFAIPVQAVTPEYQVKAAMLYKFAMFVEWPAKVFSTDTSPFITCVLGNNPFGPWLEQEMGETRVGNHPVEIRHIEPGQPAGYCHLVFVSASEKSRLQQMLTPFRNMPALIVSDVSDISKFCRLGGMICLVMEGAKVRFQLNSKAIAEAGLKIDSKLKRVALSADCGEATK